MPELSYARILSYTPTHPFIAAGRHSKLDTLRLIGHIAFMSHWLVCFLGSMLGKRFVMMGMMTLFAAADEPNAPSKNFNSGVGSPLPNVSLPASIIATDGALTLHADFAQANEGKVPLYLVNRTTEQITFHTQGNDIFLKLERKMPNGRWERVQSHVYSWCGNSYYSITLAAGHHFVFSGYMPINGIKARVRYQGYGSNSIASNEGDGFFLEDDKIAASMDQMALTDLPSSLRYYFRYDPNRPSVPSGSTFSEERFLSALRLLSTYRESPYARRRTSVFLTSEMKKDDDSPQLAAAISTILAREWPAEPAPQSLFKAALAELPEHPIPAWSVLNDFMQKDFAPNTGAQSPLGKQVAEEMKKALLRGDATEIKEVAKLIGSPRFAGEHLDDAFLEKWMRSPHDSLVQECASALCQRSKFDLLAKIGRELKPSSQLIILRALASSGARENETPTIRDPSSEIETSFWVKCATEQPMQVVSTLYFIGMRGNHNSFNLALYQPLREFLLREAQSPSKETDGWEIGQVVAFVGSWKRREDVALLRSLLGHPAYQRSEKINIEQPSIRREIRRYRVRQEAQRLLMEMGESVPTDLVLEEERAVP